MAPPTPTPAKSMGALRLLALAMVVLLSPNGGALTTGQNRTRGWGVNVHWGGSKTRGAAADLPTAAELTELSAAFGLARFDMSWTTVERADGPAGRYDFSAYDTLIGLLQRHGVRPCKCSTPCASPSEASNCCACADVILDYGNPHYDGGRAPESDEAVAALARWATAAVSRFRGQGVVWEFW